MDYGMRVNSRDKGNDIEWGGLDSWYEQMDESILLDVDH